MNQNDGLKCELLADVLDEAVNNNLVSTLIDKIPVKEDKCDDVLEYIKKLKYKLLEMECNKLKRQYHIEDNPVNDIEELKVGDKICIIIQYNFDTEDWDVYAKVDFAKIAKINILGDTLTVSFDESCEKTYDAFPYILKYLDYRSFTSYRTSINKLYFSKTSGKFVPYGLGSNITKVEIYRMKN